MTVKHKKFISAVVYLHNCEESIKQFLKMLHGVLSGNFENFEIIFINDSSSDNSVQAIREFAGTVSDCTISVVNMGFCQGMEIAMLAGLDLAIGDFVFEFDEISLDYTPDLLRQCYDKCIEGYDIVSCGKGNSRTSSKLFYSIFNRYSETQYELKSETFRIITRRAINRIYSMSPNPVYRKALYSNCGLKKQYIQYEGSGERAVKRRGSMKNPYDTALTSLVLFTNVAYKAAIALTIIMMLATFASVVYAMVIFFLGNPVEGYTTVMILISGTFFALFAILAVVIKYLSVLLRIVFRRQKYVLESIEKLTG